MKYIFNIPNPHSKYIEIECVAENVLPGSVLFHLPAWRPGRYELGNFAKNIKRWHPFDESGNKLPFKKITKDSWLVQTENAKQIHIKYSYYAAQLDAGACWLDASQLYVNPVHCCLFINDRMQEKCEVILHVPQNWEVATSMKTKGGNIFSAKDYHELVDSPFIASPSLQRNSYSVDGKNFTVWFQGECKPNWQKVLTDFAAFTRVQIDMMKEFPGNDYNFLIQVVPKKFYHGVEHLKSTVLAIGPGDDLMNGELYSEFLGLASHELFHVWNVKSIRPAEMFPYDYTRENYAPTGYIYEGITTYYGDLFLSRSGFFSTEQYLNEISIRFQKHMNNFGRFNYSVAQSSFDTWLDGYVTGVPNRKTSIYDEGSLIAVMLDFLIRKSTANKKSLDDVMRNLFFDFAKKEKGYSENDFKKVCEEIAARSFDDFFANYIHAPVSYENLLLEVFEFAGLEVVTTDSQKIYESHLGFTIDANAATPIVLSIAPGSPAEVAGLTRGDEIISINNYKAAVDFEKWMQHFAGEEITLDVFTANHERVLKMRKGEKTYFSNYAVKLKRNLTDEQKEFFGMWTGKVLSKSKSL